ncbi:MAG: hypothetical protein WB502_06920 [Thermoactinomyces sp.]
MKDTWDPVEIKIESRDFETEYGNKEFELTLDDEQAELDIDI